MRKSFFQPERPAFIRGAAITNYRGVILPEAPKAPAFNAIEVVYRTGKGKRVGYLDITDAIDLAMAMFEYLRVVPGLFSRDVLEPISEEEVEAL